MASTHQLRVQELFSIKGYVCVVTGGGTGIGLMATQALAANGTPYLLCCYHFSASFLLFFFFENPLMDLCKDGIAGMQLREFCLHD